MLVHFCTLAWMSGIRVTVANNQSVISDSPNIDIKLNIDLGEMIAQSCTSAAQRNTLLL